MATRVNTKFVFVLAGVIVLLVGALGAFYVLKVARSPAQLEREADALLAAGEVRLAFDKYGRAVYKDSFNAPLLKKVYETADKLVPTDRMEADRLVGQAIEARRKAAEVDPSAPGPSEELYSFLFRIGDSYGGVAYFGELHRLTTAKLANYPDFAPAKRYQAFATVRRMGGETPQAEVDAAAQTLAAALEADPSDAQAMRHMGLWLLAESERLSREAGRGEDAERMAKQAAEVARRLAASDVEDPRRATWAMELLLHPRLNQADHVAEAAGLADRAEAKLADADPAHRDTFIRLVELLPRVDTTLAPAAEDGKVDRRVPNGVLRAERLVRQALTREPDSVVFHTLLGRLLQVQGRTAEALTEFTAAWSGNLELPSLERRRADEARMMAGFSQADLLVGQADVERDAARKSELLAQAEGRLKEIEAIIGDNGLMQLVRGKIALTRNQPVLAMQQLGKAADQLGPTNLEAALLFARACQLAGEPGEAADQLETVARALPQATNLRLQLAEIYINLRKFARAETHLAAAAAQDPANVNVAKLQGQTLALQGKTAEAIAAFEKIDLKANPEIAVPLAALYAGSNQVERAQALLRERVQQDPKDVRALTVLMRVTPDLEARRAILESAKAGGADPQAVRLLELQVESQASGETLTREDLVQELGEAQADPLRRELAAARVAMAQNKPDEAAAALDRAAKTGDKALDDPAFVETQFELALRKQDWVEAERVATRAGSLDLDLAQGAFFRGQVAAAKGEHELAAAEYRKGLAVRPVFSDGWRRLGDALGLAGNISAARDAYRRALEQKPDNARAIRGMVAAADAEGDRRTALTLLRDSLPVVGNDREMMGLYLDYEAQHGEAKRALDLREQLAKANPGDRDNRRSLGLLLAGQQRQDDAVKTLEALIAEEGLTLQNAAAMAQTQAAGGDAAGGLQTLERYLQSKGDAATIEDHTLVARYGLVTGNEQRALAAYAAARALEDPKTRPVTRELADLLFSRGASEQALSLYRELHAQDPADATVALRFAETLLRAGQKDEALPILQKFADRNDSLMLQGMVKRGDGDRAGATALFERALAADPKNGLAMIQLAQVLGEDPQQAARSRQLLEDAVRLNPQLIEARMSLVDLNLRERRMSDAVREMRQLVASQPGNSRFRARLVELLVQTGDTTAAFAELTEAQKAEPQNPLWPQMLSGLAQRGGDRKAAIEQARKSLELSPSADALARLAILLLEDGQASEVETLFRDRMDLVNAEPVLQGIRGRALWAQGRQDEANAVFAKAVERAQAPQQLTGVAGQMVAAMGGDAAVAQLSGLTAQDPLWIAMAAADLEMRGGRHAEAASRLSAVTVPADHPLWLPYEQMLALALYQAKDLEAAAKAYEAILARTPDDAGTLNNLAYLYVEDLNDPARGLPLAERAAKVLPNNPQVLDTLGWAQFKAGQNSAAEETLRRSVQIAEIAPNLYHLAAVLKAAGSTTEARDYARRAIDAAQKAQDTAVLEAARALAAELGMQ